MARSLFGNAIIVVTMRWTDRAIGIISTLILARILVPEDFGIVAMASLTVGLVDVLLDMGVVTTLIHKQGFDADDFNTAWTIRLMQGTLVSAIIAGTAPLAAEYFRDPRVTPILWLMALTTFIAGFENIGIVEFQKSLRFGRDFKLFFLRRLVSFIVTVTLAFALRTYWALPLGALAGRIAGVWLSYAMHPFRPHLTLIRFRAIWSFSQWMLIRSAGSYVEGRFDKLLIGRRTDATVVGAYTLADDLAAMPTSELLLPVGRVLFPALVDARDKPDAMKRIYLLALSLQTMIAIPTAVGTALVADDAVAVMLGPKWDSAAPFVSILALVYAFGAISHATGYLLLTLGHVRLIAFWVWTQIGMFALGALLLFPEAKALELAELRLAATALSTCLFIGLAVRYVQVLRLVDFAGALWRPVAAAGVMAIVLPIITPALHISPIVLRLVAECVIGAVLYSATLLTLWGLSGRPHGGEAYALDKILAALRKR